MRPGEDQHVPSAFAAGVLPTLAAGEDYRGCPHDWRLCLRRCGCGTQKGCRLRGTVKVVVRIVAGAGAIARTSCSMDDESVFSSWIHAFSEPSFAMGPCPREVALDARPPRDSIFTAAGQNHRQPAGLAWKGLSAPALHVTGALLAPPVPTS